MGMTDVILKGSVNAPANGSAGAFYGKQFVFSHVDWLIKLGQVLTDAANSNPKLVTRIIHRNGYTYLYEMRKDGRWCSKYYTTDGIAKGPNLCSGPITQEELSLISLGIKSVQEVPGGVTGTFYPQQYVRTKEEWRRVCDIAWAYVGDEHISIINCNGFAYRYFIDDDGNHHSMFFTSWVDVLGGSGTYKNIEGGNE